MSNILETLMLVCFGCSWPISLAKNLKAKTAKGMSLGFTLLIILGYLCGIAAKLIAGNLNYVLVVYFLNLIVVTLNLFAYFHNRRLDKKRETSVEGGE